MFTFSFGSWLLYLWRFSRPHTIIGTSLSVWSLAVLAIAANFSSINLLNQAIPAIVLAWFSCLCGNIYIVGLNQLEDIDIDRINKPDLPLASGHFSVFTGRLIVAIAGGLALISSILGGRWLLLTVGLSLIIGTAYSLPPIRLKRFPLLAAMCILVVRGMIVNLGLSLYFQDYFYQSAVITPIVLLLTGFILLFSIAIALFKDVPDLEGDRQFQINTFTLLLGKKIILNIVLGSLSLCYIVMIVGGFLLKIEVNQSLFIGGHLGLLFLLWYFAQKINLKQQASITNFYQFIWKLFFIEYVFLPLTTLVKLN